MSSLLGWLVELVEELSGGSALAASALTGAFAAATTTLGSLAAFVVRGENPRWLTASMSFAAGVMLVASFTSLILPALELSRSFPVVALGIITGVVAIRLVDRFTPHEHLVRGYEGPEVGKKLLRKAWLIALAVIIHNFPEGLAVGTTCAYSVPLGVATALAIGIQDIPEGVAVALPVASTHGRLRGFLLGLLSGLSELVMAVAGAAFFTVFSTLLPLGMGFAGGAMMYVVLKEVVPELYTSGENELRVTTGFLAGFLVMLLLDSSL
uniref:ZIP family metal transporter n=1 Tax=Thermofilum pendens TaxID=2269 RepID=A0A7C4FDJ7_THEPE